MNYDKFPSTKIDGYKCYVGYQEIIQQLKTEIKQSRYVITFDTYPGVDDHEVLSNLKTMENAKIYQTIDFFKTETQLNELLESNLTDDRVFGRMFYGDIWDLIDQDKFNQFKEQIDQEKGLVLVYGFGASLIASDLKVYLDLSRWEIQLRYRQGMSNFNCSNNDAPILSKYKRGFFIEWRIADKHKVKYFNEIDYFIDTNQANQPKMITGTGLSHALDKISAQPFRTVPYFDPGVWGGQWMKDVCGLDKTKDNFAWSFDGVPEENSLLLQFDETFMEIPAMNLVLMRPQKLLGPKVFTRFGAEFPIRFDFLDTVEGQNLSLQVHPLTEYIKKHFGMPYTQDESYYILDAKEGAVVYLGLKDNINPEEMINDLKVANQGEIEFDAEKYINKFPAKKHDHFLIPAGTCHCSGSNAMVLEISATPYIFTFKLWDWNRLGLDGKPRPVHIDHGKEVIQWDRTTNWVKNNLVNNVVELANNQDYIEERTGLHELEFIETRRYWINTELKTSTNNNLNVLNLIEGEEAVVLSPNNSFEPFTVHYAETFIIPAQVNEYIIKPTGNSIGKTIGVIKAYVR